MSEAADAVVKLSVTESPLHGRKYRVDITPYTDYGTKLLNAALGEYDWTRFKQTSHMANHPLGVTQFISKLQPALTENHSDVITELQNAQGKPVRIYFRRRIFNTDNQSSRNPSVSENENSPVTSSQQLPAQHYPPDVAQQSIPYAPSTNLSHQDPILEDLKRKLISELTLTIKSEFDKVKANELALIFSERAKIQAAITFEERLLTALNAVIKTRKGARLNRGNLDDYLLNNTKLVDAIKAYALFRVQAIEKGSSLQIEQYRHNIQLLKDAFDQSSRLQDIAKTPIENQVVSAIVTLIQDSDSDDIQESWAFLQVPYSAAKDLEIIANRFQQEIAAEGDKHPASLFAGIFSQKYFFPTIGTRPDYQTMDVEGERVIPGVTRGTIAEVVVPGIKHAETDRVILKSKVILAL